MPFTAWKVSEYRVFSGPYFPVFGLNKKIYSVNLRIQSGYRKIRTRKNSVFGHFSRSVGHNSMKILSSSPPWTLRQYIFKGEKIHSDRDDLDKDRYSAYHTLISISLIRIFFLFDKQQKNKLPRLGIT